MSKHGLIALMLGLMLVLHMIHTTRATKLVERVEALEQAMQYDADFIESIEALDKALEEAFEPDKELNWGVPPK